VTLRMELTNPALAPQKWDTIDAMLRLIWPNPDRHGSGAGATRKPDLYDAQAVLQIAITVVQFVRAGVVVNRAT
jgi:hypothetical protein